MKTVKGQAQKFMHLANKTQCKIAGEMSQKIKDIIILAKPEKVQEPEELRLLECSEIGTIKIQDTASTFNLLDRLKWAHEHAQEIPDLEAELREAQFVLKILDVAGFIKGDKLDEARDIARTFFY